MILFLSMGSQVVGTGSDDISGFSWDEGTVGVGNESSESWCVVWGNGFSYWCNWGNKWSSMGGQVFGTGSNNISGFSWDYGTVGVSYECWGIWVSPSSVCSGVSWVSSISVSSPSVVGTGISVPQTIVGTAIKTTIVSSKGKSLGGKVSVFGCEDLWGLSWGNCTVGVGDELSAGNSDTCEENQEFHVCD
jgi:hypothetical protein